MFGDMMTVTGKKNPSWSILGHHTSIFMKRPRRPTNAVSHDNRLPGKYSNPGHNEYNSGMPTIQLRNFGEVRFEPHHPTNVANRKN
jgi:hypothetical protein